MFGLFNKKKREMPPFGDLVSSPIRDKFFIRLAPWDWLDQEMIQVFDLNSPRIITMDPWPQLVYLEADGQKTIYDFVYQIASKYGHKETIPNELDKTILEVIDSLLNDNLIKLLDSKTNLPDHIKKPRSTVK